MSTGLSLYNLKTRVRDLRAEVASRINSNRSQMDLSFYNHLQEQHHMKGQPLPRNRFERLAAELAWLQWMMKRAETLPVVRRDQE